MAGEPDTPGGGAVPVVPASETPGALHQGWLAALRNLFTGRSRGDTESGDRADATERKFASILEIAADAIISIDDHQLIVHFNRGAEEIFGWKAEEMIGRPLSILLPPRFHEIHARHITEFGNAPEVARRMGERSEIFGQRRDGTEFPAEASISRLDLGDRRLFTVVLRDVTERKRLQEDQAFLARAAATLAVTLDYESTLRSVVHLAIPYLADCCVLDIVDPGTARRRIASVHEDAECTRRLRRLEAEPLGSSHWPFPVASALTKGVPVVRQNLPAGWERDGSPGGDAEELVRSLGITAMMVVPVVGRARQLGALTLLSTDRRRTYDAGRRAIAVALANIVASALDNAVLYQTAQRATAARDELLAVVSHDLRNPLSAIAMCASVLRDDAPQDVTSRRELLGAILESADLMQHLIQDLLDVAILESGHLTIRLAPERLESLVQQAIGLVGGPAAERGVTLHADVSADFAPLHVDANRTLQVMANLLGNAVKFTEPGGRVTVTAERTNSEIIVSVRDTGPGIPHRELPYIFDRYWKARRGSAAGGTGLGLAIARGIVEAHGGRIWVDSTEGQGSIFHFTIPAHPPDGADR